MTDAELAELRGEIFGLKIIAVTTLSHFIARVADPAAAIDELQRQSTAGIAATTPQNVPTAQLLPFRNAAAAIVLQATDFARKGREP